MTVLNELIDYANKCIDDIYVSEFEDYISCKKHKQACKRLLNDIERYNKDKDFPYYWNEEEAEKIVEWFSYLRHSKGVLAGEPIILTISQKFDLCQLYGWRRKKDNTKRFRKFFKEVARKNAKSQELAGINLYEISYCSLKNGEVYEAYTAGVKRKQSKIIVNECRLMLRGSPLRTKFKITRDKIEHKNTGSYIEALCKDDGENGDGSNPAILTLDEYHEHKTTEFYDLHMGSNTKDNLLAIITTAGKDLTYPCYIQEYTYCSKVLDPNIDVWNDEYLIDIYELDDIKEVDDERAWLKANPVRCSYEEGKDLIRAAYKIAKEIPEKLTAFLTKMMNVWVQAKENGYMDMAKWKSCEVDKIPIDTRKMNVYVGFDMSAKIDLTSVAFIIPYKSGEYDMTGKEIIKYILYSHSFIPNQEKLAERKAKDKVDYDAWERMGYLTVTDTPIVDQNYVMEYVLKTCKENEWSIETLCFDPANASKIMMDLSDEGFDVEEVFQSHKHLNECTQGFREQVYSKNILYLYNPLLNYSMSNAVIRTNQGLIKIDKDATTKRIDPVDAALCAFKLAMYHEFGSSLNDAIDKFLEAEL